MFFRSAAVGLIAAITIGLLAFALSPFFDALGVYIAPAGLLLPVIGRVIPSNMAAWWTPDGGPTAGVLLVLLSTLLFWTVMFGLVYFAWANMRRKRAARRAARPTA
jgi:hypothetical protein